MITGGRRGGRTWRQLQRLPDKAVYLVSTSQQATYCKRLLVAMGRQPNAINIMTTEEFTRRILGTPSGFEYDIDHATFPSKYLLNLLAGRAHRYPFKS